MHRIALAVALLALTVSTGAQAPTSQRIGLQRFMATKIVHEGGLTHLTGAATVWVGNAVVTADEAYINLDTDEIEFRGNVRMKAASRR